ncbi:MAG TPA: aldose epimerase family protein [Niabella sp.]|nr:aldose epimerase family protein [Niabella sp.]HQW14997.1 aldose epimerase family protein [Niabella sp.]HQX20111.1 aldose epimerase family protein [Niabella sp.]HQX40377.1 aldose epimerase family protein [Niabella sp.]HRB06716.1 aldose epimerase family protein [Niabella sp.]
MIDISAQEHGKHPNGQDIFVYTLKNTNGTIVEITNYGAIIMAIKVKKSDNTYNDIVLGFEKPSDYWNEEYLKNYPFFGAVIGRYANRIDKAAFTIDDTVYPINSTNPGYVLHGGMEGFDKKVWDRVDSDQEDLVLRYVSPDGEEGFPGELDVRIRFQLSENDALSYEYFATTSKPTAVNLTHHSYFNLNNGKGNILHNHHLKINASQYLEQDPNYCTTGKLLPVIGTRNDFMQYNETGNISDSETGIDISFQLDNAGIDQVAAEAFCDEQDIKLEVFTTEPLVHLYNACYSPTIVGKEGTQYSSFSGFCYETQVHPNAIRITDFPNTILRPGENYYTKTIYRLSKKGL